MLKAILRLIAIALIANATWHLFTAYMAHYKFRDAVEQASQFGNDLSDDQLHQRVVDLAVQYDVPVGDAFTIRREAKHTIIEGTYARPIELLPTVPVRWPFSWHTDTLSFKPAPGEEASPLKP